MVGAAVLLLAGCTGSGGSAVKAEKSPLPAVKVRAEKALPERGQWALQNMWGKLPIGGADRPQPRTSFPPLSDEGLRPPDADQLMLLEAWPNGATLVVWMPDSTVACTGAFALDVEYLGKPSPSPSETDDPANYARSVACTEVPKDSKVTRVTVRNGGFPLTEGLGAVVLLTGPDEPLLARDMRTGVDYGPMPQQVGWTEDGRTFRFGYYLNAPFTPRDAEVCTADGDRCLPVD
ncbi:hypothetical protein [Kitasatospora sp. CB02891]|uniref:hypothetical protein n=1 Tax=Kitasatospora sp. CB02891 TaxID=2020329 RepID=UPI000C275A1F|nr:hypothetical protein [Kitasatospora sp. CB02891]PJN23861.1 hypothetical protein CG736_21655 [Kitasatospora sp. CB02891]